MQVDTLYVVSSSDHHALADIVASLAEYNTDDSYYVLAVDLTAEMPELGCYTPHRLIHADPGANVLPGFSMSWALQWALGEGFEPKQVIMLDESVLVRGGPAIGDFWLEQAKSPQLAVIGVGDTSREFHYDFDRATTLLTRWGVTHAGFEKPPMVLADHVLIMYPTFFNALRQHNLLTPDDMAAWPSTYGAYISWVAQFMNMFVVTWGYTHKVLPPLYVGGREKIPAPHLLAERFHFVSDVRRTFGYAPEDIRELFKQMRGQSAREVAKYGPQTHGYQAEV